MWEALGSLPITVGGRGAGVKSVVEVLAWAAHLLKLKQQREDQCGPLCKGDTKIQEASHLKKKI